MAEGSETYHTGDPNQPYITRKTGMGSTTDFQGGGVGGSATADKGTFTKPKPKQADFPTTSAWADAVTSWRSEQQDFQNAAQKKALGNMDKKND